MTPQEKLQKACERLIQHRRMGDLHPIDYQRIEDALTLIKDRVKGTK